jgi:diacylglycerol kinase (ATP)
MPIVLKSEELEIDEDVMFFLILNTPGAGGFKRIVPQAQIDDGLLDVVVLRKCLLHQLTPLVFQFGDENGSHLKSPFIHYFQTKHLNIASSSDFKTDLDGESGPEFPLDIRIIPKGIKMIKPRLM